MVWWESMAECCPEEERPMTEWKFARHSHGDHDLGALQIDRRSSAMNNVK